MKMVFIRRGGGSDFYSFPHLSQQTKETILHFLLMRSLLLASTIGASQTKPPVELLLIWLSVVAFLRGIVSICTARFDYVRSFYLVLGFFFFRICA
jgi:hypothetical protein